MVVFVAAAFAGEPVVTSAEIAASPEVGRAALADPVACGTLSPDVLAVTATPAGDCTVLDVTARGAWNPLRWRAIRCPTADGWREDLVASTDVTALHTEWRVFPGANGTSRVEYHVDTEVSLPGVPDTLVRQNLVRSARATVARLVERVTP